MPTTRRTSTQQKRNTEKAAEALVSLSQTHSSPSKKRQNKRKAYSAKRVHLKEQHPTGQQSTSTEAIDILDRIPSPVPIPELPIANFQPDIETRGIQSNDTPAGHSGNAKKPVQKDTPVYSFLLSVEVSFNDIKLIEESGVHTATPGNTSYNFQAAQEKEIKVVYNHLEKLRGEGKELELDRAVSRATVMAEGKGFCVGRSVDGPEDWEEVEKIVRKFIDSKKKIVRVLFSVKYTGKGAIDQSGGGDTDENSVSTEELQNTLTDQGHG